MGQLHLQYLLPFTADKITNLGELDFLYLELFGNRFSKLQDYMGNTLFDLCLTQFANHLC